jgi:hypothetical protein
MKKLILLLVIVAISHSIVFSQGCLPEGITFTTQEEIDNFQTNYPGCTEIEGDVIIGGYPVNDSITNLNGLSVLTHIAGFCSIVYNNNLQNLVGLDNVTSIGESLYLSQNPNLNSLNGLENLETIGQDLNIFINPSLSNLQGLNSLKLIGNDLKINSNDSLINLNGMDSLTNVGRDINIDGNNSLQSLSVLGNIAPIHSRLFIRDNYALLTLNGLESVTSIEWVWVENNSSLLNLEGLHNLTSIQELSILNNDLLTSLNGLENLTTIEHLYIEDNDTLQTLSGLENFTSGIITLYIKNNPDLTSLAGIENFVSTEMKFVEIYENHKLAVCDVKSICYWIENHTVNLYLSIWGNAPGCNSFEQIKNACKNAIDETKNKALSLYPNPATSLITIHIKEGIQIEEAIIYNHIGQKALVAVPVNNTVDVSTLRPGIYFIEIATNEWRGGTKLIIE